ncbi:stage II sporulation protein D [Halobacteroides halobius DSM 5150]|uniref:Stage II sporulation protein D n=1 Tax=Halobacteroides halobius (strain ATCC 35273 / DSM 5150 / MD-1) TaxID=748449 RepID=L0KE39_HALHC|nr:stage II sporulation protein D [Halobacteroides halobius]AGB42328.1 stage II sporulation protein D [Halobacteroides halobius DSM 5150]
MKDVLIVFIICSLLFIFIIPTTVVFLTDQLQPIQKSIKVYNSKTKEVIELQIEEYLKGVLAAEMPASFPIEALKAQAVAARTYTFKRLANQEQLTTNSRVDQAWLSQQDLLERWGLINYFKYWPKVSAAVEETKGLILTYQGRIIDSVYHSSSGGQTASAKEVWGNKIPYLQSVRSRYERSSPYNRNRKVFTMTELSQKLNLDNSTIKSIRITKLSNSGRVLKIKIGDRFFTGQELRNELGLLSTDFSFDITGRRIEFITSGYGHGVGLSQYGAQGMANQGYSFSQILKYYYHGVKFSLVDYD